MLYTFVEITMHRVDFHEFTETPEFSRVAPRLSQTTNILCMTIYYEIFPMIGTVAVERCSSLNSIQNLKSIAQSCESLRVSLSSVTRASSRRFQSIQSHPLNENSHVPSFRALTAELHARPLKYVRAWLDFSPSPSPLEHAPPLYHLLAFKVSFSKMFSGHRGGSRRSHKYERTTVLRCLLTSLSKRRTPEMMTESISCQHRAYLVIYRTTMRFSALKFPPPD